MKLNDLTKIAQKDFGYDDNQHFLEFLNKKKSKWEFVYRQIYPEDSNRSTSLRMFSIYITKHI